MPDDVALNRIESSVSGSHRRGRPKKAVSRSKKKINGGGLGAEKLYYFSPDQLTTKTELTGIRKDIFLDRYSLKDELGKPTEDYPEQMWLRVAQGLASVEKTPELQDKWSQKFYELMKDFKFVPAGRILSGAGTGYQVTFYNCYVIPSPKDSRDGIMDNIKMTVEIQARAGGVGVNLSSLRPRGARVKKVNGTSSGPVNWAALYSTANHDVIQQGGSRRGALMLMLDDWHPDVEEFINVKSDLTKLPGANLSLCISEAFMGAVKNNEDWSLIFPELADKDYDEIWDGDIKKWQSLGKAVKVYKTVKAREIWNRIAEAAWKSAEPGVVFMDRYNRMSNTWYFEKIICTNPCGEQGLGPWAVCNLGSMNAVPYVGDGRFDFEEFAADVKTAIRMLDNTIDANYYFYDENKKSQENIRRTGLGLMGLADAMILLGLRYGDDESVKFTEDVYRTMRDAAYKASIELASEKGSFGKFDREKYLEGQFIKNLPAEMREEIDKKGIRNAVILSQAPTGTISLLAGVSSGLEPVFEFAYKHTSRLGEHVIDHPLVAKWKENHPEEPIPDYFVGANDLTPEEHIKVQAAAQKYIDSSISKTVNAPNSHTTEDVKKLYNLAYDLGCKGITYFRDGSRAGVLTRVEEKSEERKEGERREEVLEIADLRVRPHKLAGATYKIKTPLGTAFIVVNDDEEGNPFEVFINIGRAGSDVLADAEAIGRLISLALRIPSAFSPRNVAESVVEQLAGIGGGNSLGYGNHRVKSLADAVAKVLDEHLKSKMSEASSPNRRIEDRGLKLDGQQKSQFPNLEHRDQAPSLQYQAPSGYQTALPLTSKSRDLCPNCGQAALVLEEGCSKCYSCGYSKC